SRFAVFKCSSHIEYYFCLLFLFLIRECKVKKYFFTFAKKFAIMKILVFTEHDDCCGPMAAAFLSDYSEKLEVVSVGEHPAEALSPMLVAVMRECLIDMENYVPRDVASVDINDFDAVYECPDLPCPTEVQACRDLRDFIKNEAFLYYKKSRL
ncbi:MAG: hypothetical protein II791_01540, partial [Bacteroidales bacterium]|nr:hypothetical protein [Bacteroidales bacterium]